jgi:hypothetical protein
MRFTDEQVRIVGSRATRLAVEDRAGTGKTSTLCAYAEARQKCRNPDADDFTNPEQAAVETTA